MAHFLRSDHFSGRAATVDEASGPTKREEMPNPYFDRPKSELRDLMLQRKKWRHYHDLPFLKEPSDPNTLLSSYAKRVDTMLRMAEIGLRLADIDPTLRGKTACDLACAEGFTANHFLDRGAEVVDGYELNQDCIARMHMVRAYKNQHNGGVYKLDLVSPTWSKAVPQYDVVFCCGIIYHMENPMLFMQNVFEATKEVCILETDTPLQLGEEPAFSQVLQQVMLSPGEPPRPILELRPNRKALVNMMLYSGFKEVWTIDPPEDGECRFLKSGSKSVFAARK